MDNTLTHITDAINALENKTILTTPGFHLSLTNFTLSPTLTYLPCLSLDNKLPHSLFLHSDWPLRFVAFYIFTATNYYSIFVILHASQQQNHPVY